MKRAWLISIAILLTALSSANASDRLRVIIETDAGGDPDDEQSLVRFLLYVNEWDVEGIIANRPIARDVENLNRERTGFSIVRQLVNAYGQCWTNLVQNDPRYPKPEILLAKTVAGYSDKDDAVDLIIRSMDAPGPRPVWYSDWGSDKGAATNNLQRALDRVLRERGPQGYAKFKSRIHLIATDHLLPEHTALGPAWTFWINTWEPPVDNKRWYHRFSAITARAGGFDIVRDALQNHGPLGALYPTNTTHWQKEGDTLSFLYLVPTGMNDPMQPTWGSWAGRYGPRTNYPNLPYFFANQTDFWNGAAHRDNTLKRWAEALQNDFRARLDWCVKPRVAANHPPQLALNGNTNADIVHIHCQSGDAVKLSAVGSADPDGQALDYEWHAYPEAGTYAGPITIDNADAPSAIARVPNAAAGKTIHVILSATDTGEPRLTRYRRAILEVQANK